MYLGLLLLIIIIPIIIATIIISIVINALTFYLLHHWQHDKHYFFLGQPVWDPTEISLHFQGQGFLFFRLGIILNFEIYFSCNYHNILGLVSILSICVWNHYLFFIYFSYYKAWNRYIESHCFDCGKSRHLYSTHSWAHCKAFYLIIHSFYCN